MAGIKGLKIKGFPLPDGAGDKLWQEKRVISRQWRESKDKR
jgi:hypothetical protein